MGGIVKSTLGSGGIKGFAGNLLGSQLESVGLKRPEAQEVDPAAYAELYNQAMEGMRNVGQDEASKGNRDKIQKSLGSMLGGLEDNSAQRKANFQEDMARGFQADAQSLARAKGGTGSLQQALRPSGAMYDSQARARSRGLTDLYGQGVQDLSNLQGVQGNMFQQDFNKAQGMGNLASQELASRRGTLQGNAGARWDANMAQNAAVGKTREQVMKMAGMAGSGGAGGGGAG